METRANYLKLGGDGIKGCDALEKYLHSVSLPEQLLVHLIKLRASQMNGCAYCIDMHWKGFAGARGRRSSGCMG